MINVSTNEVNGSVKNLKIFKWDALKSYYKKIHAIDNNDTKESEQRIGAERLNNWVKNNLFDYGSEDYINAEIRYFRIQGGIYKAFLTNPHNYINTCAVRLSKALSDFGIKISKLEGMQGNAYLANAGSNANPHKIIVRVGDMIDFLNLHNDFEKAIKFTPQSHHKTNIEFRKEVLSQLQTLGKNAIVAMLVEGWGDAGGHITLWDNKEGFLDKKKLFRRHKRIFYESSVLLGI